MRTLWTAALLAGCSGAPQAHLSLDRFETVSADYDWVEFQAVFSVVNPRPLQTELDRFAYSLSIAGMTWLEGEGVELLTPGAAGPGELVLPLGISTERLYAEQRPSRGSDTLPAAFSAEARLAAGERSMELDEDWDVVLLSPRAPSMSPVAMQVEELDEDLVEIEILVEVDNDMGSELELSAAELELLVDGVPVYLAPFSTEAPVAPASRTELAFSATTAPSSGGAALVAALERGQATVGVEAELVVESVHGRLPCTISTEAELSF